MSNITNNRINLTIPPADQVAAKQHFIDLKLLLPFLLGLEAEEKKGMQGINVSNKQWVEDCLNEMWQEPSILPGADERYKRLKERFVLPPETPKPTSPPTDGPALEQ